MKHNWAMQVAGCFALMRCDRTVSLSLALDMHPVRFVWVSTCPEPVHCWETGGEGLSEDLCLQPWLGMVPVLAPLG